MPPWLTIVLIGLGIIVYTRLFNKGDEQTSESKILSNMEDTFEQFAMELEDDNNRLLEHVLVLKEQFDQQSSKLLGRIEFLEKQLIEHPLQTKKESIATPTPPKTDTIKEVVGEPEPQAVKLNIKQRYGQLFDLHHAGKSMDYIAKKLAINKGEVQLILQLGKQEEQSSV